MKLLNLNMKAVGPFTGVVLDFSAGEQGLHLVYGPNEAGKTSSLRALTYLLFGFPHLSADHFVHPNEQLRVGGKLRHSDGEELELLRRRGNRNTLRGPDDSSGVADERLSRFLGGIGQDTFEALFGIDHERLTRAGEEIRTGQGRLGEILFAAGAGLAGLRLAQEKLQQGLDDLFKPRAQNPRINKALTELREAQDELKQHQLPSEDWQQHDRSYRDAIEESERLRVRIRAARGDQGRLKRIQSAIPIVAHRQRLTQDRDALGEVIRLRDEFGDEYRKSLDQLRLAEPAIAAVRCNRGDRRPARPPRPAPHAARRRGRDRSDAGATGRRREGERGPGPALGELPARLRAPGASDPPRPGPADRPRRGRGTPTPGR